MNSIRSDRPEGASSPLRGTEKDSYNLKRNVKIPETLRGLPSRMVGLNFHCLAVVNAACCNNTCPDAARASITSPFSSMVISISTSPSTRVLYATGGYCGDGVSTALARITSSLRRTVEAGPVLAFESDRLAGLAKDDAEEFLAETFTVRLPLRMPL